MTIEEIFSDLCDKYGEDFNWYMIPLTQADGVFVTELKNEIGKTTSYMTKEFGQQQSVNRMMMCYMLLTTEEMWTSTIFSI